MDENPQIVPKKVKKLNLPVLVLSITCFFLVSACVILAVKCSNLTQKTSINAIDEEKLILEEEGASLLLNDMKSRLSSGDSVLSLLKEYYPDKIVYAAESRYVFADIISSLAKNSFDKGQFNKDSNNIITYSENGSVVSHKGIDVSEFQGDIDFSKVKTSGIEYAIIRCGYRGYGSGKLTQDSKFKYNITNALQNNINVGVYFFTQAISKEEAIEEADYVIDMIKPYKVTYPIVLDVEEIVGDSYRQQSLSKSELTDVIIAFCDRVSSYGYTPMIYGNLKCLIGEVDLTRLTKYDKWFAYYDDEPYYPYEISMWQYTDSNTIDGITGSVDYNISFKTWGQH